MTTSKTSKKTAGRDHAAARKGGTAKAALPLAWEAVEYVPRKRWWWYAAVAWIVVTSALLLVGSGEWIVAAVVLMIGITLFVIYLAPATVWSYELRGPRLLVSGRGHQFEIDLEEFRGHIIETMPTRSREIDIIVLIPRKRLGRATDVYLPFEENVAVEVREAISRAVPVVSRDQLALQSLIAKAARGLRIG